MEGAIREKGRSSSHSCCRHTSPRIRSLNNKMMPWQIRTHKTPYSWQRDGTALILVTTWEGEKHHDHGCVTAIVPALKYLIYYIQKEVVNNSKQYDSTCFPFCENRRGWGSFYLAQRFAILVHQQQFTC